MWQGVASDPKHIILTLFYTVHHTPPTDASRYMYGIKAASKEGMKGCKNWQEHCSNIVTNLACCSNFTTVI
jgi:hypothetical protein